MSTNFLDEFPFIDVSSKQKNALVALSSQAIETSSNFHGTVHKFVFYIMSKFGVGRPSSRLSHFYDNSGKDFIKELKRLKVSQKGKDEYQLLGLFEDAKKDALDMLDKLYQTERKINKIVYELYGLTDEEIKIVEESVK